MPFAASWSKALRTRSFQSDFALFLVPALGIVSFLPFYFQYLESRKGIEIPDPFLALFDPLEISGIINLFTYAGGLGGFVFVLRKPEWLLMALKMYVWMMGMRLICLYLVPLEPPGLIIPLKDVFLDRFFYSGKPCLKDLFFSGHTATVLIFAFVAKARNTRLLFIFLTTGTGVSLLAQHVHYTVDVVAAPVFVWIASKLSRFGFYVESN